MKRYVFQEVALYGSKFVKCAGGCGRRLSRRKKFWQTINPFNKDKRGLPKSRVQIQTELGEKIRRWETEPVTCRHCALPREEGRDG